MSILTDISSGAVGGLLGGVGQLAKDIRQAITGDLPAEKQAEITQKLMELENAAMSAQTTINLEEAKSEHLFVSGWRPFVGWVCGFALAYVSIFEPFISWCARLAGSLVVFPQIDTTITMQVLVGLLGLGAYRSYDKAQSPAPKGKE
ncbi:MAG: hypothetical protein JZU65_05650 [Chlorobium sp.]|nr:hypothetical protein [Chlorobium sp.]